MVVQIKVKEEVRLAATVHTIDTEVSVVPRGAFIRSPHGLVQTNRSFEGLPTSHIHSVCVLLVLGKCVDPGELRNSMLLLGNVPDNTCVCRQ